jgi:hypothetical protein
MPSRFEPGGIVQHEFFIASTPAVVFATGGLKDSVIEFNKKTKEGNGFLFSNYERNELLQALHKAYEVFKSKENYQIIRKNAFDSAFDVANVSKEWCAEVYRLRGKVFVAKSKKFDDLEKRKDYKRIKKNYLPEDELSDVAHKEDSLNIWSYKDYNDSYKKLMKSEIPSETNEKESNSSEDNFNDRWEVSHTETLETNESSQTDYFVKSSLPNREFLKN